MVALGGEGGDVLTLDFPGVSPEKRRTAHRPAKWTKGPAKPNTPPEPSPAQRAEMATRELAWKTAKRTEDAAKARSRPAPIRESRPPKGQATTVAANPTASARILAERKTSPLANAVAEIAQGVDKGRDAATVK
jgi:hypothetical protein